LIAVRARSASPTARSRAAWGSIATSALAPRCATAATAALPSSPSSHAGAGSRMMRFAVTSRPSVSGGPTISLSIVARSRNSASAGRATRSPMALGDALVRGGPVARERRLGDQVFDRRVGRDLGDDGRRA
jgi:hypothetical protein